ncbi:MAG: nicotinate-nucleotide--dimethylbenzimidazole phosphoribosyltransferase [Clostridium fessum]
MWQNRLAVWESGGRYCAGGGSAGGGSARLLQACAFNFCADNGVVEEGVSQTGQEVTAAVVSNMTRGRSCSCLMAEKAETDVFPIDMGIACEVEHRGELHPLTERKIRRGTSNFTKAAAMTRQ